MDNEIVAHESFGMINISNVSGGNDSFYGTDVKTQNYKVITIQTSEMQRNIYDDKYFAKKNVVSVKLTPMQFAELFSNPNTVGVPCTIIRRENKAVEQMPEIENRRDFVLRSFKETIKDVSDSFDSQSNELAVLLAKLPKKDALQAMQLLNGLRRNVASNIPYIADCFKETVDTMVTEGLVNFETKINNKIFDLGFEKLQEVTGISLPKHNENADANE